MEGPHKRWRLAIFAIAFVVRIGAIVFYGPDIVTFGDARDYLATASHLCREHEYPDRGNLPFFRAPLLPFFITATTLCHPERVVAVKVALAACDSGTALVIGEMAWLLFGSSGAATVAALLAALDPFFIFGVVDVRTEPLFMFFLTLGIWGFLRALRGDNAWAAFLSGVAFALASLTRPAGLAALTFAGITLLFARGIRKLRWREAGALGVGAAIVLLPWVARNAGRYHEVILVNDAAGFNFWRGSHPEMDRIARIEDPAEYRRAALTFETELTSRVERSIATPGRSPRERSRAWLVAGFANVSQDPAEAMKFAWRKAWRYWRPWLNPQEYGRVAIAGSASLNILLYSLAVVGLGRQWKRDRFVTGWVIGYFLVIWLAHIPLQVVMRFRIPFTDPLMIAFAASAMIHFMRSSRPGLPQTGHAAPRGRDRDSAPFRRAT
jgi:4-amino-4-deoxy-L-arabinose transferase-like glycosyltransferase